MASIGSSAGVARVAVLAALVLASASCAVPTSPSPEVLAQPDGRGIVAGVDSAPSAACESGAGGSAPAGTGRLVIESSGVERTAMLRVPTGTGPHPVLVSLHPFSSGAVQWDAYSGLAEAAAARGYVVVSPQGSQPGPRWAVPGGLETGANDVQFISDLLDHIEDTLCVDRNAEFAAGYSAGAAMAQALSCTMPWRFSAVAGSGGMNLTESCPRSPATDVLTIHGDADPIAPTSGSKVVFAPPLGLPIDEVVATNAERAGCEPDPDTSSPAGSVRADTYRGCAEGHRIAYWRMVGGGHTWAGAEPFPFDAIVGPTLDTFSANDAVLGFFGG